MAGDIQSLPFMQARIPLIDYHGNNGNDQKHSQDRTTALVRKWSALNQELQGLRQETITCCEATPGKGNTATLSIVDRQRFDDLQEAIKARKEHIDSVADVIRKLDEIIVSNGLGSGWLQDLQHRLNSASSSIYQQKSNISKYLTHFTVSNPRLPPEEVIKIPEFIEKRTEAERLIKLDEEYLAKFKPVVEEIEAILASVI
jgi:hypothetical protein